jgi:hypothetical protein
MLSGGRAGMKQDLAQETKLRRYLLAELTLEEQVLVEQRLFLDSDYSELAQAVEDDLIDEYVHDDLDASEREKFESHFLNQPEHRGDLRIAEALEKYLASGKAIRPSFTPNSTHEFQQKKFLPLWFRLRPAAWFALAAMALIIISVVTWIAIRSGRRQHSEQLLQAQEPRPTQTVDRQQAGPGVPVNGNSERVVETSEHQGGPARPKEKPTSDRTAQKDNSQLNSSPGNSSLAFAIYPGGISRSETQTNRVSISSEVDNVILKLPVRTVPDYASYSATLKSHRRLIRHWPDLPTEVDSELGKIVKVDVATSLLSKQRYEIELVGIPADSRPPETYSFWVDKK